jgi:hypothetical protein
MEMELHEINLFSPVRIQNARTSRARSLIIYYAILEGLGLIDLICAELLLVSPEIGITAE